MSKYIKISFLVFGIFSFGILGAQSINEITVEELEDHIDFLASDSLKGRKPGTAGGKIAAEYIRDQFKENGITPLGEDGFQYFNG